MRPGSVIVDLAAETGGNCELTAPGTVAVKDGVTIDGTLNLPSQMPFHASQLYANNVVNLLTHLAPEGELALDFDDEITAGAAVTHDGRIVNERVREAVGPGVPHEPDQRDHDLRAGRVRRLRGDLEGPDDAAHAADVGHERDPRHRAARRPAGRGRRGRGHARQDRRHDRGHFGTINIVGGFLVTDRMLEMFKGRGPAEAREVRGHAARPLRQWSSPASFRTATSSMPATWWRRSSSSSASGG